MCPAHLTDATGFRIPPPGTCEPQRRAHRSDTNSSAVGHDHDTSATFHKLGHHGKGTCRSLSQSVSDNEIEASKRLGGGQECTPFQLNQWTSGLEGLVDPQRRLSKWRVGVRPVEHIQMFLHVVAHVVDVVKTHRRVFKGHLESVRPHLTVGEA